MTLKIFPFILYLFCKSCDKTILGPLLKNELIVYELNGSDYTTWIIVLYTFWYYIIKKLLNSFKIP